jgi:hypothetical protein
VRLDKVCSSGQTCSYEYDYGTTTELRLKVISEREVEAKGKAKGGRLFWCLFPLTVLLPLVPHRPGL